MIPTQLRWKQVPSFPSPLIGTAHVNHQTHARHIRSRLGALERLEARELMAVLDSANGSINDSRDQRRGQHPLDQ